MITKENIVILACHYFEIQPYILIGKRTHKSNRNDASQRFICWYLIYKHISITEHNIANYFGFNHSTVHYGIAQVCGWLKVNETQTVLAIEFLEGKIKKL
jgi:chromosomal replication initiation ATPase DnaA